MHLMFIASTFRFGNPNDPYERVSISHCKADVAKQTRSCRVVCSQSLLLKLAYSCLVLFPME